MWVAILLVIQLYDMIKLFISYKWDTKEKNNWVERLYSDLRLLGFDARLDKYEVGPGDSFSAYMTKNIKEVDYVIFIITNGSKTAVESGKGALAFEMQLSNARKLASKDHFSIIPILREGDESPTYLSDHRYLDFRKNSKYRDSLKYLTDWLNKDVQIPRIGYDSNDPKDIIKALRLSGELTIQAFGNGKFQRGGKGSILLGKGSLEFTSAIDYDDSWWYKDYYVWCLKWDDKKGVILTRRYSLSPK